MPPWIWRFFCDCQKLQDIKKAQDLYLPVPRSEAKRMPITVRTSNSDPTRIWYSTNAPTIVALRKRVSQGGRAKMHTYGHLLLLSSLTVVKKFLRLSERQEQSEINAFPNTGIPTPLRTSVHTFPTTKIAIRMETPQIYKTFFNPPTNPHHKS